MLTSVTSPSTGEYKSLTDLTDSTSPHGSPAVTVAPSGQQGEGHPHQRELISRSYNLLLRTLMGARFSDAQCGFKAIRRDQARALLPLTQDTGWFFDTELLVLAERAGLRIHEIPVDWVDDLDSRVDIIATALADLRGMSRLGVGFARGSIQVPQLRGPVRAGGRDLPLQIARFTVIGVASTIAYVVLFLLLRTIMSAQVANLVSLRRHRGGQHRREPAADVRPQRAD